jgi:xylan 1,4-beta-xylosidase
MAASAFVVACGAIAAVSGTQVNHTTVTVDVRANGSPLLHSWKASVGSGHALLGLREDWRQQLAAVQRDLGIVGVRFHGSFDDDMGPVVANTTGGSGGVVYNFTLLDTLYDGIIAAGVTPIVELSFMPYALADCSPLSQCRTTMYYKGITVRPRDFQAWYNLVAAFATHAVERYGLDAVASWRFECWNELWGMPFGNGSVGNSDYMALYNASYRAVKSVSPRLRIGGPATEIVEHVADFVAALPEWGVDADFVSTHLYPTDQCSTAPDARTDLNCFTNTILAARQQAPAHEFLMTECVRLNGRVDALPGFRLLWLDHAFSFFGFGAPPSLHRVTRPL